MNQLSNEDKENLIKAINDFMDYSNAKVMRNFVKSLIESEKNGRIHPNYRFGTKTYRLTSENPNWLGMPESSSYSDRFKECIEAPKGKVLIVADYEQFEKRVLANVTADENQILPFTEDIDVHVMTMWELWPNEVNAICPVIQKEDKISYLKRLKKEINDGNSKLGELRKRAKRFGLAIQYLAHPQTLAEVAQITLEDARKAYHAYHEELYRTTTEFRNEILSQAKSDGYMSLGYGATIAVNDVEREEKTLYNALFQFWSIITLVAAEEFYKRIKEQNKDDVKIIATKHDSIYIESPTNCKDWVCENIKEIMESFKIVTAKVKLKVNIKIGENLNNGIVV